MPRHPHLHLSLHGCHPSVVDHGFAPAFIRQLVSTQQLSALSRHRLRVGRVVVLSLTAVFLTMTAYMTHRMVAQDVRAFQHYVAMVFAVGSFIGITFFWTARTLRKVVRHEGGSVVIVALHEGGVHKRRGARARPLEVEPRPEQPSGASGSSSRQQSATVVSTLDTRRTEMISARATDLSSVDDSSADVSVVLDVSAPAPPRPAADPQDVDRVADGYGGEGGGQAATSRWVASAVGRIAQSATRVSACLAGFLLGGLGWFLARNVVRSVELDRVCVMIIHSMHAAGLAFVGQHVSLTQREIARRGPSRDLAQTNASDAVRRSSSCRSDATRRTDRRTSRRNLEERRSLTATEHPVTERPEVAELGVSAPFSG